MRECIFTNLEKNPEFDYYLFSDEESRAFIQKHYSPEVVKAFDILRPGAYKSDLWRYCVLYVKGGVYFDIKLETQIPLVDLLSIQQTMLTKDHVSATKNYDCLWNGLMISAPGNELFRHCIESIVKSCRERNYERNNLDITGPCLLGRMVKIHQPTLFSHYSVFALSKDKIIYNSKVIFTTYKTYREEQKKWQKGDYYGKLYTEHKVYHE
jgi:mannosyltransferase OCH1-like enzyme